MNTNGMAARYAGKTVLAIGAHPDDIEIGIGGTVARLKDLGARVVMAVASVPNKYKQRVAEARAAAKILGGELHFMFNGGCSRVEDMKNYDLVRQIDRLIAKHKPVALFAHGSADFHRDHQIIYGACLASQRMHFLDFFCYYPTACRSAPVKFHPQAYVDISKHMETKMKAVNMHRSQFSCRGLETDFFRDIAREQGRVVGMPFAETLEVVRMSLLD